MNSPRASSSPSYKNLRYKHAQSPIELKEKMRKDYKNKIQNCRNLLMNKFRGTSDGGDIRNTLAELYKNMFNFTDNMPLDIEESELLEEIKQDLIEEEMKWCLKEYEKSQMDNVDWSSFQNEDGVICPLCQKNNFKLIAGVLSCEKCGIEIKTHLSLLEIKTAIFEAIETHSRKCASDIQFSLVPDIDDNHIYVICDLCLEMQLIV